MLILFLLLGSSPFCPSSQQVRGMKLQWTNFWPFAEKSWTICRECQQILGHLPRLPRTICRECQRILGHLPRLPRTICQECQQILGHLPRLPRTAIKICLPRMPSLPWLALAAGSFGSLGSR